MQEIAYHWLNDRPLPWTFIVTATNVDEVHWVELVCDGGADVVVGSRPKTDGRRSFRDNYGRPNHRSCHWTSIGCPCRHLCCRYRRLQVLQKWRTFSPKSTSGTARSSRCNSDARHRFHQRRPRRTRRHGTEWKSSRQHPGLWQLGLQQLPTAIGCCCCWCSRWSWW